MRVVLTVVLDIPGPEPDDQQLLEGYLLPVVGAVEDKGRVESASYERQP